MSTRTAAALVALLAVISSAAVPAFAQRAETRRVEEAATVFKAVVSDPGHQVPDALIKNAYAIAIVPGVRRIGFVVGGQRGSGVLLVRGKDAQGWEGPVFVRLAGASVGWQIGIQSADIVLFFRTKESVRGVLGGKFTLGVGASIATGSVGRQAGAVTDEDLGAEIYSYSRTRGVFAGVTLEGASIEVEPGANAAYYGRDIGQPLDFLEGARLPAPPSAAALRQAVATYEKSLK